MATSVNAAFAEFLQRSVRLNPEQTKIARTSRDNLISNITSFSGNKDFFKLVPDNNLKFGSFARRTKIRPLDDIDLMICISADGRTFNKIGKTYYLKAIQGDSANGLTDINGNVNSIKVINRFIKKLASLYDYSRAEMHRNQEAMTLQLKSYTWNFDIVPCWYLDDGSYLIPDGSGNWKLTNPKIDNQRTSELNQVHKGYLLDVIRLMKFWNERSSTYKIGSYLLECMILDEYTEKRAKDSYWVDIEFKDLLDSLSHRIMNSVYDPKGIQGNLNNYTYEERMKISDALDTAYEKASLARDYEGLGNQGAAIRKWIDIFGSSFPDYS